MIVPASAPTSFADVGLEEALERARALVPALRERAARAETARRMLPETEADLHRTGLFRFLQPKRYGGMELDFPAFFEVPAALARGCASTAWNVFNLGAHHWTLALFDERAQHDVWGENPDALIASGIAYPQGQARRVEGGYILSGRWNFSSGVDMSEWNQLSAIVRDGERPADYRMCLLHKTQYEVIDDWHVLGMRGTGSKTVVARDVFVPEYRAVCMLDARGGTRFAGARVSTNPLYHVPLAAVGSLGLGGAAVGNAQAALEFATDMVKERSTSYTAMKMRDFQAVQLRIGAAAAKIDAAQLVMRAICAEAHDIARRGAVPDMPAKLRYRRDLAYGAQLCTEAVDMLHAMAGANGIYDREPLERIFRDAHALGGHISFSFDAQVSAWGLGALGGEVNNPTL